MLRLLVALLDGVIIMRNEPFALFFLFRRTEDTADKPWAPEQCRRRIACSLQVALRRHSFLVDILVLGVSRGCPGALGNGSRICLMLLSEA